MCVCIYISIYRYILHLVKDWANTPNKLTSGFCCAHVASEPQHESTQHLYPQHRANVTILLLHNSDTDSGTRTLTHVITSEQQMSHVSFLDPSNDRCEQTVWSGSKRGSAVSGRELFSYQRRNVSYSCGPSTSLRFLCCTRVFPSSLRFSSTTCIWQLQWQVTDWDSYQT